MKISKSIAGSLFVTLMVIGAIVIGMMYKSASADRKTVQGKLTSAELSLNALNKQKTDDAAQLAQAAADVASWNDKIALLQKTMSQTNQSFIDTQKQFTVSAETIEYTETLTGLAKASNLTISSLVATETAKADNISTSEFNFNTNVFTVHVQGKVSDILAFIDKISSNAAFKTGVITPIGFSIPVPLTQAAKDQLRADIKTQMISDKDATIKGHDRVLLIEQAILSMLGDNPNQPTAEIMTQIITQTFTDQLRNPYLGGLLASAITQAIDQNLADTLISTVSRIYGDAIAQLFTDKTSSIVPTYTGSPALQALVNEINDSIQGIPDATIPGVAADIISKTLQDLFDEYISDMVPTASIDAALNAAVTAAEMPSANLTVAVYSYKGA